MALSRTLWALGCAASLAQGAAAQLADGPVAPPETAAAKSAAPPVPESESRSLAAPAKPGLIPQVPPVKAPGSGAWMLQTGLSLGAVVALAAGAGWVVRSMARRNGGLRSALGAGGRAPAGILEILGRYPVSRGATLILLKLDRRILLLSQTSGGRLGAGAFSTLSEITDPEEVASILVKTRDAEGDSMAERFRSMLGRYDRDMETAVTGAASGRRVQTGESGDSAEVWDISRGSIPIVDLTRQPGPAEHGGAASLRRRLAALRGSQATANAGEAAP